MTRTPEAQFCDVRKKRAGDLTDTDVIWTDAPLGGAGAWREVVEVIRDEAELRARGRT